MALYGRDANGNDAYIRGTGTGALADGYLTFHDVFSDEVLFLASNITASADLVTAVASKKIRVTAVAISSDAACTIKFQTNATTDISGTFQIPAAGTVYLSSDLGLFESGSGEKLNVVQTGTANVGLTISYRLV